MTEPIPDLPYDVDLEQALLGAFLRDNRQIDIAVPLLEPKHLFDPLHQRLYDTMIAAAAQGAITPLTVERAMRSDPGLKELGGRRYLVALVGAAPAQPATRETCRILRMLYTRRELARIGGEIADASALPLDQDGLDALLDRQAEALYAARHGAGLKDTLLPFIDHLRVAEKLAEEARADPDRSHLTWGLKALDDELGPLFRTDMIVIAGATSMAKTALAEHVFDANGRAGKVAVFYSLEMPGEQLGMRRQSRAVRVSSDQIRRGRLTTQQIEGIVIADQEYEPLKMYVDSRPNQSVAQMRAKCQTLRRRHGDIALVVVDHLQFVDPADPRQQRPEQLIQITRDLKFMARDLNCVVMLLSHITKENERRDSPRPRLADLYGSVGIQQNADMVAFIFREHYYLSRTVPNTEDKDHAKHLLKMHQTEGRAEVYTDKNRLGRIGKALVQFEERFTEFSDIPRQEPPEGLLPY